MRNRTTVWGSAVIVLVLALTAIISALGSGVASASSQDAWGLVYRNDFSTLNGVAIGHTSPAINSSISPSDSSNKALQHPTVPADVAVVNDGSADDGRAMSVSTMMAS